MVNGRDSDAERVKKKKKKLYSHADIERQQLLEQPIYAVGVYTEDEIFSSGKKVTIFEPVLDEEKGRTLSA